MMPYSLHVALLLAACWVFYKLLLQKETYYKLNRVLLQACLAAAFLLPLVPVPPQLSMQSLVKQSVPAFADKPQLIDPVKDRVDITINKTGTPKARVTLAANQPQPVPYVFNRHNVLKWVFWLYCCGVVVFSINFLIQIIALFYQAYKKPVIRDGYYRIVEIDDDKAPCSFGSFIFINPTKYDWETYNQIITHEKIHIKQGHSFDLLLAELMLIVQWFNPFAWLYRKEIESNIEFLTDDAVIHGKNIPAEEYQLGLLKVAVPSYSMRVTTNYNQSLLKRRIMMMNAKRSNIHSIWKYMMLLPFLAVMICGFNKPMEAEARSLTFMVKRSGNLPPIKLEITGSADTNRKDKAKSRQAIDADTQQLLAANPSSDNKLQTLTTNDIISLNAIGVTPDYIKSFKDIGYTDLTRSDLMAYYTTDVTADYIKSFNNIGLKNLTPNDILAFRTADVTADYVKGFYNAGMKNLTVNDILTFRTIDITADYVKTFDNIGLKNLSPAELNAFNTVGVTANFIKGFQKIGLKNLTPDEIIAFNNVGVTDDYVKSFQSIGLKNLTPENIVDFNAMGVTADYVKSLMDIGYKDLKPSSIISNNAKGISANDLKEKK